VKCTDLAQGKGNRKDDVNTIKNIVFLIMVGISDHMRTIQPMKKDSVP
jgi:hypothetical protein